MRVALISDIHGNLPALQAVVAHARSQSVLAIWNMGDSIGYGANPDRVLRLLQQEKVISIQGNFDRDVLRFHRKKTAWREKRRPEEFLAIYWADENISEPSRDYLAGLQENLRLRLGETRILLSHGSPASRKEKLSLDTPAKTFRDLSAKADAEIICCGHSHQAFYRKAKKSVFINPGSVGGQRDGDPRASYAVIELDPAMLVEGTGRGHPIEFLPFRVEYDLERAVAEIRRRRLPEAFAQMFLQGRDLASVLEEPETWQVSSSDPQSRWKERGNKKSQADHQKARLEAVIRLAEKHAFPAEHVEQTTFLSLRLFDELQPLHRLGAEERFWLECGALLHDIGKGEKDHHLKALKLILKSKELPFSAREKSIIGSIARYHRRENPKEKHAHLADLAVVDQRVVTILSSLLRVADGLDAAPRGNVVDLTCSFSQAEITIHCQVRKQAGKQKKRALGKGELMEFAFNRDLYIEWFRI